MSNSTPRQPSNLQNQRILITGATGSVGYPVALALAAENQVIAAARFSDETKKNALTAAGVECITLDFASGDFSRLPADIDYVLHFAVSRISGNDFEQELRDNAEATGLLMQHCRSAKAFLHCSSCAVYHPAGHHAMDEASPLGDNHRNMFPTYSVGKNAAEAVARFSARAFDLPTIICRLNVPYGESMLGWPYYHLMMMQHGMPIPVSENAPSQYCLIHEQDIVDSIPALLGAASTPATIVNWANSEVVSIEEWCEFLAAETGLEAKFQSDEHALPSVVSDNTRFVEIAGACKVDWRSGMRRLLAAHPPTPH